MIISYFSKGIFKGKKVNFNSIIEERTIIQIEESSSSFQFYSDKFVKYILIVSITQKSIRKDLR